jgi:type VI secretion system protein ImpF
MVELSLKDRLQPALLDRLTDDERLVTVYRVALDPERLAQHKLGEQEVERALGLQGLRRVRESSAGRTAGGRILHEYVAAGGTSSPLSPRALRVRSGGDAGIPLTTLGEVEASSLVNTQVESADRRAMSMTRLREAVLRDLRWLFNSSGIDDVVDLEAWPEVRRSVLNYGLRSMAGKPLSSIDPIEVARRIRDVITFFEPRLSSVRVTPEVKEGSPDTMTLAFVVEAELWGQPVAQHVSLRTSIDVENGDVAVADRAGRA